MREARLHHVIITCCGGRRKIVEAGAGLWQGPHPPNYILTMRSGRCGRQKSVFKHLEFGGELA